MLRDKAMLASMKIHMFGGSKLDRQVTEDVANQYGTAKNSGRYTKQLIPPAYLKPISGASSNLRNGFYANSAVWNDAGERIITTDMLWKYQTVHDNNVARFNDCVGEIVDNWDDILDAARLELNGLFNPDDYPSKDNIASKFGVRFAVLPFPSADDFRVDISDQERAMLQDQLNEEISDRVAASMSEAWDRDWETRRSRR